MAQHSTHKRTAEGKAQTLARRSARKVKRQDFTGYVPVLPASTATIQRGW